MSCLYARLISMNIKDECSLTLPEELSSKKFRKYFYKSCGNLKIESQYHDDAYQEYVLRCLDNNRKISISAFLCRFKYFAHGGTYNGGKERLYFRPNFVPIEDAHISSTDECFKMAELNIAISKLSLSEAHGMQQYIQGTVFQNWIQEAKPGVLRLRELLGVDSS